MPFNSYPELASAATWYPAPVAYLEGYDDLTTLADLQHVSWTFRGIVLSEGHLAGMPVYRVATTIPTQTIVPAALPTITLPEPRRHAQPAAVVRRISTHAPRRTVTVVAAQGG